MKAKVIIEKGADGSYNARMQHKSLGFMLLGSGKTVREAITDFLVSKEEIAAVYQEENKPFPVMEFTYLYDLSSFLEYYSKIFSFAALERLTGINQSQLSQYVQGYRKPSKKTAKRIESKLHELAKELHQVQFV